MVLWQGLTEGGTAVPVQVTEAGKVVAEGKEGQKGDPGEPGAPGPPGPPGPRGEYGPGDDVDLGSITASGGVAASGMITSGELIACNKEGIRSDSQDVFISYKTDGTTPGVSIKGGGSITAAGNVTIEGAITSRSEIIVNATSGYLSNTDSGYHFRGRRGDGTHATEIWANGDINTDGKLTAAENAAGITNSGELYLTSRGTRYKLVVAGGLVTPEPFTRQMELKERAEALRKPRTTDSVPED